MNKQIFTAIIFCKDGSVLKYRNIQNYDRSGTNFYNPKFLTFVENKDAVTINLYDKFTKQFFKQIKVKP